MNLDHSTTQVATSLGPGVWIYFIKLCPIIVSSLIKFHPTLLAFAMAPHSSALAWKIPWTEEPGGLQSMGSWRVRHDWVASLSLLCTGEGNGNPLQCSCLENPRDRGAWWAAVYGVAQSRTRLKRLSSSSSYLLLTLKCEYQSWTLAIC